MSGIAYGVNLIIGKVLDSKGLGHYDAFMKCIIDATNNGANIINLSLGVSTKSIQWTRSFWRNFRALATTHHLKMQLITQ